MRIIDKKNVEYVVKTVSEKLNEHGFNLSVEFVENGCHLVFRKTVSSGFQLREYQMSNREAYEFCRGYLTACTMIDCNEVKYPF